MSSELTVRTVDPAAEPAVVAEMDRVMRAAFEAPTFAESIAWYVAVQPDALAAVFDGDRVVGTGAAIAYPDGGFGWIGLIGTRPGHERRGVGSVVTSFLVARLRAHGCAAALDASAKGRAVYERLGFADLGPTVRLARAAGPQPAAGAPPASVGMPAAPALAAGDRDAVIRYDAATFGADRRRLLNVVLAAHPAVVARGPGGAVVGYAVARSGGALGPVMADDADALGAVVAGALDLLGGPVEARLDVPWESTHPDALAALGFVEVRRLRHMRFGVGAVPGRRDRVAGQLTLGFG